MEGLLHEMNNKSIAVLGCVVAAHVLGIVLVLVNGVYLLCTRGYGSARIRENSRAFDSRTMLDNPRTRRFCTVRNSKACNVLVFYHVLLFGADVISLLVCNFQSIICDWRLLAFIILLAVVNYFVILLIIVPFSWGCGANKSHAHCGCFHNCFAFEVMHFLLFWGVLSSMITAGICNTQGCKDYGVFYIYIFPGFLTLGLIYLYMAMWAGSALYYKRHIRVYKDIISKEEAAEFIRQALQETPALELEMSCNHWIENSDGEDTETKMDTEGLVFSGRDVKIRTQHPLGEVSESMFTRQFTKLKVMVTIRPSDRKIQTKILDTRKKLKARHKGHLYCLTHVKTVNRTVKNYFVGNLDHVPFRFNLECYWCAAMFGLSLPYRLLLYFHVGHIKYKITKYVYSKDAEQETQFSEPVATNTEHVQELITSEGYLDPDDSADDFEPPMSPPPPYEAEFSMEGPQHYPISLPPYIPPPTPPPGYTTDG